MQQSTLRTAIALAVFAAATSALAADDTFDKTLTVTSSPSLAISTGSGNVHVSSGSDNQVHIVGHVHASHGLFGGDAEARVKQIIANPPITQSGNTIKVGVDNGGWGNLRNISIDYDVTTPKSTTLKAETGSGNLNVANLDGAVTVQTGSGDVKAESLGSGAKLGTGSGTIDAEGMRGAVSLDTGSGDIRLQQNGSAEVKAQTGSGSIRANGVNGGLKAGTGSGDIEINGQPTADWKLDSGSGSIRLGVGNGAKFTLNAETGSGTVHVDQPITMQGDLNRHHVRGAVNGGGVMVRAETGSGDISIR